MIKWDRLASSHAIGLPSNMTLRTLGKQLRLHGHSLEQIRRELALPKSYKLNSLRQSLANEPGRVAKPGPKPGTPATAHNASGDLTPYERRRVADAYGYDSWDAYQAGKKM